MPSDTAARKCPALIFVRPRFDVYRALSQQIREIFAEYTPMIEPLSLDEAYLDVTENLKGMPIATDIALEIRVSYGRTVVDFAKRSDKPNNCDVVVEFDVDETHNAFVEALAAKQN